MPTLILKLRQSYQIN